VLWFLDLLGELLKLAEVLSWMAEHFVSLDCAELRIDEMWIGKRFRFAGCSREFRYGRGAMHLNEQSKPVDMKIDPG
jgi:hypothetical protein